MNEITPFVHQVEILGTPVDPSDLPTAAARALALLVEGTRFHGHYPARYTIALPPELRLWQLVNRMGGCINDRPICGADRGTILIEAAERRYGMDGPGHKEVLALTVTIADEPWDTATGALRVYKQMASCRPVDFTQIFGPEPEAKTESVLAIEVSP